MHSEQDIVPKWFFLVSESREIQPVDDLHQNSAENAGFLRQLLLSSPAQIWKSRISWRIAFSVFLTIVVVQIGILLMTVSEYEQERLYELRETGRSAIAPVVAHTVTNSYTSPVTNKDVQRLLNNTKLSGIAVYSATEFNLLGSYGQQLALTLYNGESIAQTYRSQDGSFFETIYKPTDLNRPYYIVARLDSSGISKQLYAYVRQSIMVTLLMSAFVTTVLMITLGHWLLEPILFLRNNLISASDDPENPRLRDSPYNANDEIGGAIHIAHRLIQQNADNIRRIKSAAEDQIHRLAYYDSLTGLPNRTLFVQKLSEQTRKEGAGSDRFAVVTVDLDHFKDINDSMGHNVGDAILRAVGRRLRSALPETAIVARTGEDEYAVMTRLSAKAQTAKEIGERVSAVIRSEPFKVFNENFQIRASIGASTYPDDGVDPDQVLKNADIALNRAKEEGRDTVKEYSEDFDRAVQMRFQMLRDLRDALEHEQLDLHYQPQFDLKTGRLIGAEALLRWFKPDQSREGGTFISPADFVPIAEQSGLIVPIGEWVLRRACQTACEWSKDSGDNDIRIAVNVSGAQFHQSDLVAHVRDVLEETGLASNRLELEVTESVFMDDIHHTVQILQQLHALGVELAIDDFGTGYSSLSYLRQFPIDRLKIDQSFIRNALNNPDDASIAKTIVRLGHSLNLRVIAEGVETKDHELFMIEEGCDEVQGFRYSRPIPNDAFVQFLSEYSGDLSSFG